MINKHLLAQCLTGLQALLCSLVVMGCVNDNYKFDKIDVTLGFGGLNIFI